MMMNKKSMAKIGIIFGILALGFLAVIIVSNVRASTVTLTAGNITEDGYVDQEFYGRHTTETTIPVGPPANNAGYIEFNILSIPDDANITDVVLNISCSIPMDDGGDTLSIHDIFAQPSATIDNQTIFNDAKNGTQYANPSITTSATWYAVDLGATADTDLQNQLASDWFAVGLNDPAGAWGFYCSASESASVPQLIVSYDSTGADATSPVVNLILPIAGSTTTSATNYFYANFTDNVQLKNATLYVWDYTLSLINNTESLDLSGLTNSTNISISLPYEGIFYWNYYACDNSSNCAYNSTNWTLSYSISKISLNLTTPSDISIIQNVTQNRFFNVTVNVSCSEGNCGNINVSLYMDTDASDNFNRADGSLGTGWTQINPNYTDTVSISSNRAMFYSNQEYPLTNQVFAWYYMKADGNDQNVSVYADTGTPSCNDCSGGILARGDCNSTAYGLIKQDSGAYHVIQIIKYINSSDTVLATGSGGSTANLIFVVNGTTLRGYDAGVLVVSTNDSSISTGNCVGFHTTSNRGSEVIYLDDWNSTNIANRGVVSTITNSKPFYTNESNPRNISLNENQSQLVTFWVNATGAVGNNYTFFVYANRTADMANSNITGRWNVTILEAPAGLDTSPPYFTNITENKSYAIARENINFSASVFDDILVKNVWLTHNFDLFNKNNQSQVIESNNNVFGNTSKVGQQFRLPSSLYVYEACVRLSYHPSAKRRGNITLSIYQTNATGLPYIELANVTISNSSITTTPATFCRNFSKPAYLVANTTYALVISAPQSVESDIRARQTSKNLYPLGSALTYTTRSGWRAITSDLNFTIRAGSYIWKNESLMSINLASGNISQIKQVLWARNESFNYRWCANDSSGNQNCSQIYNYYVALSNLNNVYASGSILSPPNNTRINGNITLYGIAGDSVSVDYVYFQFKNSTYDWTNIPGCEEITSSSSFYNCRWNTHIFSNDAEGYDIKIVPCNAFGNCNASTSPKHYVIDRTIPIDDILIIYPRNQSSVRNTQNLTFKINVTDGSGAGINSTGVFSDLSLLNGTGNSSMTKESGSEGTGLWSWWNITTFLSGSITGSQLIPYYISDNATPTNNILYSTYILQVDNNATTYDSASLGNSPSGVVYNQTNVSFFVNAFDNYLLSYYTFSYNFTGTWINESLNFTQAFNDYAGVEKTMEKGNWSYYFTIYDDAGNFNKTFIRNITVLGDEPSQLNVTLIKPEDEANLTQANVTFSYNYTGGDADTCNLHINHLFNLTAIAPAKDTTLIFQQNFSDDMYAWFVRCNNSDGNDYDSGTQFFNISIFIPDVIAPYFLQTPANITLVYGSSLFTEFNASDETGFSCFAVNDSRFAVNCSGYFYNSSSLQGGLYTLNITINDTNNNLNTTFFWVNVTSLNGEIRAYINHTIANFSSDNETARNIWLNGTLVNGTGVITLYLNESIINSGNSPLSNQTNLTTGYYNFTALYLGNDNYTSSVNWLWLTITNTSVPPDVTPPNFTNIVANHSYAIAGQKINFSAEVIDNIQVNRAWFTHNFDATVLAVEANPFTSQTASSFGNKTYAAQSFRFSSSGYLTKGNISFYYSSFSIQNITVEIRTDNSGSPSITSIATTKLIRPTAFKYHNFNFTAPPYITANVSYWMVLINNESSNRNYNYFDNNSNPYSKGMRAYSSNAGATWSMSANSDLAFNMVLSQFSFKNESFISINLASSNISQVKQLLWAKNESFNYRWCANDSSGNTNCSSMQEYRVYSEDPNDTIFPTGAILSPPNSTKVNGNITIDGTAADNKGVYYASMQFKNSTYDWTNFSGCEQLLSSYDCRWNTHIFSNDAGGYDVRIVPCDIAGNCNTTIQIKHYTIDRTIPIDDILIIYPRNQSSVRNTQNLTFKINVTDGSGAGINSTGVFADLSLLNGTGNSSMTKEAGSEGANLWSWWNITSSILNAVTTSDPQQINYYVYDNATPLNNLLWNTFSAQIDNQLPWYDNNSLGNSPGGVIYNQTNLSFSVNAFDNFLLSYYTFSYNFTGNWQNESLNFTQAFNDYAGVEKALGAGNWSYYFTIYDDAGNLNKTVIRNITVFGNEPAIFTINLINPEAEANLTQANVTFSYNYTGGDADTCNLHINNIFNLTAIAPAKSTNIIFQQNFSENLYYWFVRCNNSYGTDYYSEERKFNIDSTAPLVNLSMPADSYSTTSTAMTFNYNVSDASSVNCSLIINNAVDQTNITIDKSVEQSFAKTLSAASYTWQINCTDSSNNQGNSSSRSLTIASTPPASDSCFPAETKILMADGTEKNIENMRIGDEVLSYDEANKINVKAKVLALESPTRNNMCQIIFSNSKLKLTDEHPVYTSEGWKSISPEETSEENSNLIVGKLEIGDEALFADLSYRKILEINCWSEISRTYNLKEISSYNNYYADNILVHNKGGGPVGCSDTCRSKGFNCNIHTICNKSVDCGNCSVGVCSAGRCIGNCTENWQCSSWSSCVDNMQTRTCADSAGCGTTITKPETSRTCSGCEPVWSCGEWGECSVVCDLKNLVLDASSISPLQERTCIDTGSCNNPSIETKNCSLAVPVTIKKVKWCYEDYLEIYERDTGKLVSRVRQWKMENLTKLNIGFLATNSTGYCSYCYNYIQDYDETGVDCGGSCPECIQLSANRWDLWFIIRICLWLLLLLLLLLLLYYILREKHEDRKIKKYLHELEYHQLHEIHHHLHHNK